MILLAFFRPSSALRYESNRKKEVKKKVQHEEILRLLSQ